MADSGKYSYIRQALADSCQVRQLSAKACRILDTYSAVKLKNFKQNIVFFFSALC